MKQQPWLEQERNRRARGSLKTATVSCSPEFTGCVVDLGKIAELGQAYAQFELMRTMATEAQTRYGKHLELCDVERMGDIAKDANEIMGKLMAAFDRAK